VLVVNRFRIDDEAAAEFTDRAQQALVALAARPGYVRGELGRAYDDPQHWALVTEWESVGAYRRALGGFDVKMLATPLLAQSIDEPSAFEVLAHTDEAGALATAVSDRAVEPEHPLRSRP
jgi:hypothetical protein